MKLVSDAFGHQGVWMIYFEEPATSIVKSLAA